MAKEVWYRYTQQAGYGFSWLVPALIVNRTDKKVTILALKSSGYWNKISVSPKNLKEVRPEDMHLWEAALKRANATRPVGFLE